MSEHDHRFYDRDGLTIDVALTPDGGSTSARIVVAFHGTELHASHATLTDCPVSDALNSLQLVTGRPISHARNSLQLVNAALTALSWAGSGPEASLTAVQFAQEWLRAFLPVGEQNVQS